MEQVVPRNNAALRDCRAYRGKRLWGKKESNKANTNHLVLLLQTNSCLPLMCPFCLPFVKNLMTGYKSPSLRFSTSLWLWNNHLPLLRMNQKPWNNKPTGSIIISSPCNQHSRLMRQKMKTSARENLWCCLRYTRKNKPRQELIHTVAAESSNASSNQRWEMRWLIQKAHYPANQTA